MFISFDAARGRGVALVTLICLCLWPAGIFAQAESGEAVKTTLCEMTRHPEAFDGKLVQLHAVVESGVDDLPAGMTDESCAANLKFVMPADQDFGRLVKSKGFQKLIKEVKKHPVVETTVTGRFKRTGTPEKPIFALALDAVQNVAVKPAEKHRRVQP